MFAIDVLDENGLVAVGIETLQPNMFLAEQKRIMDKMSYVINRSKEEVFFFQHPDNQKWVFECEEPGEEPFFQDNDINTSMLYHSFKSSTDHLWRLLFLLSSYGFEKSQELGYFQRIEEDDEEDYRLPDHDEGKIIAEAMRIVHAPDEVSNNIWAIIWYKGEEIMYCEMPATSLRDAMRQVSEDISYYFYKNENEQFSEPASKLNWFQMTMPVSISLSVPVNNNLS